MAADGSIIIDVNLDDKQAQQELNRLNKRIQSLADQISNKEKMKLPLVEQSRELSAELDAAKVKLQSLQSAGNYSASAEQIADQKERVRLLQAEWNKVQGKVERYDESIQKATVELNTAKSRAGELQNKIHQLSITIWFQRDNECRNKQSCRGIFQKGHDPGEHQHWGL